MWFSVVCTLIDNDTRHHSDQQMSISDINITISEMTKEIFVKIC